MGFQSFVIWTIGFRTHSFEFLLFILGFFENLVQFLVSPCSAQKPLETGLYKEIVADVQPKGVQISTTIPLMVQIQIAA